MASAWGNSWGVSWGNSWGAVGAAPAPSLGHVSILDGVDAYVLIRTRSPITIAEATPFAYLGDKTPIRISDTGSNAYLGERE